MDFITLLIYGALFYVLVWFLQIFFRQRGLPNGPFPYPLLGNIPSFYHDTHLKLDQMSQRYGAIFTLWFGRTPVVIVNDFASAEEVFLKNDTKFSDRPDLINKLITKRLCRLPYMNYCPKFIRNQAICRKACLVSMPYLDTCISKGFLQLKEKLEVKSTACKDFIPTSILNDTVMDLLSNLIYGSPVQNATFADFNLPGNRSVFSLANTTNLFRWMRLFQMKKYLKFKDYVLNRERILQKLFDKQRASRYNKDTDNSTTHSQDTIMNVIIQALIDEKISETLDLCEDEAEILCSDLFFVSIEKIAAALNWMFLYFVTWPEIQLQVYEKISNNQKDLSYISVETASKIPFLQAAVYETLRLSAMTPLSTLHQTNDNVTLKGHKLSKGTWVCVNIKAIHQNSRYWDEPYQFNPMRFIDLDTGKLRNLNTMKGFFPFGAGIRECLGNDLSIKLLTTLMANIVLNFNFDMSPWHMKPSLTGSSRLILVPNPYFITMTKRN